MRQKIHTGCGCSQCTRGKNKQTRAVFHRMMRRFYKRQIKRYGDIQQVNKSIGYTD